MEENLVLVVSDIVCIKLLTRLRLDFNHLSCHKFKHNLNNNKPHSSLVEKILNE